LRSPPAHRFDVAAANSASITLTDLATGTAATVQRVVSGSGRVLAIVPSAALTAAATYRLENQRVDGRLWCGRSGRAGHLRDESRQPRLYSIPSRSPSRSGRQRHRSRHRATRRRPALTSVLIINAGNGTVASFQAGNDGSMNSELTASIRDRLIVTITDPQGRSFSFERNTYVAADGTTGVGAGGGKVKSATTAGGDSDSRGRDRRQRRVQARRRRPFAGLPERPVDSPICSARRSRRASRSRRRPILSLKHEAHLAFAKPEAAPANGSTSSIAGCRDRTGRSLTRRSMKRRSISRHRQGGDAPHRRLRASRTRSPVTATAA